MDAPGARSPGARDLELADRLRERYDLKHVLVAATTEDDDAVMRRDLGAVAADLLAEIAGPHDLLGLGWARTVLAMAAHLRKVNVAEVVQLTGALTRPDVESSATELVRDVARRVGARASVFYAPMIVSDPETARALVRQPQVADAFARFGAVTKAVIGVGGWNPGTSTLSDALTVTLPPGEGRAGCRASRVCGPREMTFRSPTIRTSAAATVDVMSSEHLDELRRRLAEQTHQGSASDRVTTVRLARMRRRLSELEHISENTVGEAAMSAEEEVHEIMDSLDNVRDLRPDDGWA